MGLTRQSVHTTVDRLLAAGLVELAPNADHRRSQLVRLTELAQARYEAIDRKQAVWINQLADGLDSSDLEATARVLNELCTRLETDRARAQTERG
jgi:DNA-binding MarR family transcriptional regulator